MNVKKFILSLVAVLILLAGIDFVIHGLILSGTYKANAGIWRADMMKLMWLFYISYFIFALLFVYIFQKGFENKGIIEGVRYGIVMSLLLNGAGLIGQYVMYPIPLALAIQWFIYGSIEYIILGIAVSLIYAGAGKRTKKK
jgi:hypothetical protein